MPSGFEPLKFYCIFQVKKFVFMSKSNIYDCMQALFIYSCTTVEYSILFHSFKNNDIVIAPCE